MGPPLRTPLDFPLSAAAASHMFFGFSVKSRISQFPVLGCASIFCGHISSSFVKRNQRRVTPQTSDWLKKGAAREGRMVAQGGAGISVSGRESGSLRGRKLFNGAYMSNIARRKSRTERRRRELVAAAVAVDVDVGSCSCCWKLREIFFII